MLLLAALTVFTLGACLGLYMAGRVLRGRFAPWRVSLTHALLGATGLGLLVAASLTHGSATRQILLPFSLFLITALGGFFLASFHLRQRIAPKFVVAVHVTIGLMAFAALVDLMRAALF